MKYPLHELNDIDFENLVGSLCHTVLGTATFVFAAGKDGGRDAKFQGRAHRFPSEAKPWEGNFIIQAKHTTKPTGSCSDSEFRSIISEELPKIEKMANSGELDHYLLFTNRSLTGLQEPKLQDFVSHSLKIQSRIIGGETIQNWLQLYPLIPKVLGLNRYLLPIQFYEKDLQEIVTGFSNIPQQQDALKKIQDSLDRIPIEEKNRINNLTEEYFKDSLQASYSNFAMIAAFLSDPKNSQFKNMYDNTVSDLRDQIIVHRDNYAQFEAILDHLYQIAISAGDGLLMAKRRLVRVFLHYMYYNCDIGRSAT